MRIPTQSALTVLVLLASTVVCRPRELLTGPDFLAVFMRSRAPSTDHYLDHNDVLTRADQYESFKLADMRFEKEFPTERPAETTTQSFTTTEAVEEDVRTEEPTTEQPSAVVSVRVSSSVVRSRPVLSVQDQPQVTAVQRSHLGVEEGSRTVSFTAPDKAVDYDEERDPSPEKVSYSEEHTVYRVEGRRVPDSVAEASQEYRTEERTKSSDKGATDYRAVAPYDPQKSPVSYRTSVSTATSGSRVQFYREPPAYVRTEKPPEPPKNYEEPEKVYGTPERNYEVDEAVSVGSDGRAHGVQEEKAAKFGYVVEGRNFRKYRVEERTADGFIVGEYGVVSHDDGSLRGVRYTADSNISPRLIYDALVKFLSLK